MKNWIVRAVVQRLPRREALQRALLLPWALALLIGGSYLQAPHVLTLPVPAPGDAHLAGLAHRPVVSAASPRREGAAPRWQAVHILYSTCGCSQVVLRHLLARGAAAQGGVVERIVAVDLAGLTDGGAALRARAAERGFLVDAVTAEQLRSTYHVEAAPLLLVMDGSGAIRYVGGYSERKRGPVLRDGEILRALAAGRPVAPLPVFGCAVSASLQATLDPLRIGAAGRGPRVVP